MVDASGDAAAVPDVCDFVIELGGGGEIGGEEDGEV